MPTTSNKFNDFTGQTFFVGLDVHKKSWAVTVRTLGFEVSHFIQDADAGQLSRYLKTRYPGGTFVSAYEAGFCGTSVHHLLCKAGIKNIIINPADLPQTDKQKKNKTDMHDSRAAARYLEAGLLKCIHIMPVEQQERRALFRLREAKVKEVTRCSNRLRSFLYYFGITLPEEFRDKEYISRRFLNWLDRVTTVTPQGKDTLNQHIGDLIYQRQQLLLLTKKLRTAIRSVYPDEYHSIVSVPGIGPVTTMGILAEIGNLNRFKKDPDQFTSYLGLMPAERSSGDTVYNVRIQPRCNKHLRPLLIEAAWMAIRRCPVLLNYYKHHVGKNNKKAIVKVARKLALISKAVALNKTTYQAKWTG